MRKQRENKGKGESGSKGARVVLPLHLGDGLDNWGNDAMESNSFNGSMIRSKKKKKMDAYTYFVLELQHAMKFGKSKSYSPESADALFRCQLDLEDGSTIDNGKECDETEKTANICQDEISFVGTDDSDSSDDESCKVQTYHNIIGATKNGQDSASYFWRRRRYVLRRRCVLTLLAILSVVLVTLLVFRFGGFLNTSELASEQMNHIISSVNITNVKLNTIWDVDNTDMGV